MLESITKKIQDAAIEYKPTDYHLHYKGDLDKRKFLKIYSTFFNKIIQELYKGWDFHTPLGVFYVERAHLNTANKKINWGETRKQRTIPGNEKVMIYWEEDYFFKFAWVPAKSYPQLKFYDFKFSWQYERMLGKLREDLKLYIKDTHVI